MAFDGRMTYGSCSPTPHMCSRLGASLGLLFFGVPYCTYSNRCPKAFYGGPYTAEPEEPGLGFLGVRGLGFRGLGFRV